MKLPLKSIYIIGCKKKYLRKLKILMLNLKKELLIISKHKSGGGFSLVEMLVVMLIFTIIIGAISGLFISSISAQKNALATQQLLSQTSFALEYMSRALRMAKKDTEGSCIGYGYNYKIVNSALRFINHLENDDCQEFFLENEQLKHKKNNLTETIELTSSRLQINSLNFSLSGESQMNSLQPRATIFLKIKMEKGPEINIQTTVSQRNLDILQ